MSGGIFRRPHDFRHLPVAVAALFDGGSPPVVDDPPLERSYAQERFHTALRPSYDPPHRTGGAAIHPELFRQAGDSPPIPSLANPRAFWDVHRTPHPTLAGGSALTPELFRQLLDAPQLPQAESPPAVLGLRPYAYPPQPQRLEAALFPTAPAADEPPIASPDATRLYWTVLRPRDAHPPGWREMPFLPEFDLVYGRGVEQELFHLVFRSPAVPQQGRPGEVALLPAAAVDEPPIPGLGAQEAFYRALRAPWERPDFRTLSPGLFPIDSPPIPGLGAQEALHRALRFPWERPDFRTLAPALFPPDVVEEPPIPGLMAQEAFLRTFRPWPWRPQGGAYLAPSLYPVVVADEPPIPGLGATWAFQRAYRPIYVHPTGNGSFVIPPLLVDLDCCGTTLLRLNDIDAAILALAAQISTGFGDVTTILTGMAADIAVLKIRREEASVDPTKMLQELKLLVLDLEKKVRRINRPY